MIRAWKGTAPRIDPTAFVDETAAIVGDVEIGPGSSIWCNVSMRGDAHSIRVGARTNVQDGTVLHARRDGRVPCVLGDDVTVGHAAILHACTIKDRVLIGMGAIVLDRAEIGEDSIVGAGALVPMGTIVPPRSLVLGLPAKVKRALTDREVASILESARRYLGYVREHRGET